MAKNEMNEVVRPLVLHDEDNGVDYTLEFNRETIRWAESRGFSIDDVDRYPMTKIYELFYYAFRMHHKSISREKTDKIIDGWGGIKHIPDGVLERLGMLYAQPFEMLKDNEAVKNAKVVVEL